MLSFLFIPYFFVWNCIQGKINGRLDSCSFPWISPRLFFFLLTEHSRQYLSWASSFLFSQSWSLKQLGPDLGVHWSSHSHKSHHTYPSPDGGRRQVYTVSLQCLFIWIKNEKWLQEVTGWNPLHSLCHNEMTVTERKRKDGLIPVLTIQYHFSWHGGCANDWLI